MPTMCIWKGLYWIVLWVYVCDWIKEHTWRKSAGFQWHDDTASTWNKLMANNGKIVKPSQIHFMDVPHTNQQINKQIHTARVINKLTQTHANKHAHTRAHTQTHRHTHTHTHTHVRTYTYRSKVQMSHNLRHRTHVVWSQIHQEDLHTHTSSLLEWCFSKFIHSFGQLCDHRLPVYSRQTQSHTVPSLTETHRNSILMHQTFLNPTWYRRKFYPLIDPVAMATGVTSPFQTVVDQSWGFGAGSIFLIELTGRPSENRSCWHHATSF